MPPLPVISGRQAVRAFKALGWREDRQRGSHLVMVKPGHPATLSIPQHKELAPGTLRSLMRQACVDRDEFAKALR